MTPFRRRDPESEGVPPGGEPEGAGGPDETAALIEALGAELEKTRAERDEALDAQKRAWADFQNFQRRAQSNEQQAREQAVRGLVLNIIPVIDNFEIALSHDASRGGAESIVAGVTMIKEEMLRSLGNHGVSVLRPQRGDTFDPQRHEAIVQQPAEGVASGDVVATLRLGYTLNDRVIRPAQVSVAP